MPGPSLITPDSVHEPEIEIAVSSDSDGIFILKRPRYDTLIKIYIPLSVQANARTCYYTIVCASGKSHTHLRRFTTYYYAEYSQPFSTDQRLSQFSSLSPITAVSVTAASCTIGSLEILRSFYRWHG